MIVAMTTTPAPRALAIARLTLGFLLFAVAACSSRPSPQQRGTFDAPALRPVAEDVLPFAARLQRELEIPGVWVGLLDVDPTTGEERLWADVVGENPDVLAVHRVASISKVVTATAAMALVEKGKLQLDQPVREILDGFAPSNPHATAITLRHLLGHRSGLVRESPVGHYFDASEPALQATVASLSATDVLFEPGTRRKYSNPGFGVVGALIAEACGTSFEEAVDTLVLAPLGLADSSFRERPDLVARTARGAMWSYDGRSVPTPDFRFGYVPAAELRSTVVDLLRFVGSSFANAPKRVLKPDTQAEMWRVPGKAKFGCGLGWFVNDFEGARRIVHTGAVYGFASVLTALPEEGIAVAVVCTKDFVNNPAEAIAERALRAARAARKGERLERPVYPQPLGVEAARALAGRWNAGRNWVELTERGGELFYEPNIGVRTRLRRMPDGLLVADDPLEYRGRRRIRQLETGSLHDGMVEYERETKLPAPAPKELLPLLGEYGWEHNSLLVYEDRGRLGVLLEWFIRELPRREAPDHYRFPGGMYGGDALVFERDDTGEVVALRLAGARFPRRKRFDIEDYRIEARGELAGIVAAAKSAELPEFAPAPRAFELVDLMELDDTLRFDIRYATARNFLGAQVYDAPVAKLQRPAAEALLRVHRSLRARGLGLLVFDAYRPWHVTKAFWDATPDAQRHFVANPARGSRHNRGCAVDLTLYELATGERIEMPSDFDEFTPRAYCDYPGGTSQQRYYRELLRRAMEAEGFEVYEHEWWHFDFRDWKLYPIGNKGH